MAHRSYDTVSEAMKALSAQGYVTDFSIMTDKECIVCNRTALELSPDDFEIDEIHRFDGMSDPGDDMIVYAISSDKYNIKGLVVNAYGMYSDTTASKIVDKLHRHTKP